MSDTLPVFSLGTFLQFFLYSYLGHVVSGSVAQLPFQGFSFICFVCGSSIPFPKSMAFLFLVCQSTSSSNLLEKRGKSLMLKEICILLFEYLFILFSYYPTLIVWLVWNSRLMIIFLQNFKGTATLSSVF